MANAGMRIRVKRLLHGKFRPDDITTLFLHLRDRHGGRESVREMGDFVAHPDRRDRGMTAKQVGTWFTYMRFRLLAQQGPLDIMNLPINFREVEGNFLIDHAD